MEAQIPIGGNDIATQVVHADLELINKSYRYE